MDSFSESLQYITKNVDSQFEVRLQEFDNTYNENISWLENVSNECKTAFESTIERIFLAEKKTKSKQTRELFTPLKEFNYSAPDRAALSRQLATPASAYRPRTRAAVKQLQEEVVVSNKENQAPVENKIVEEKVVVKKPAETKKAAAPKGKSKVQAAVEKMEEKIIEERFGKKKVEEKPVVVEQPKKVEVEESQEEDEKKEDDEASEKEDEDKPQGRAGRLKATRTTAAAKRAAAAAKRAATLAEKKARAAREAEEREKAEKEEQERQAKLEEEKAEQERAAAAALKEKKRLEKEEKERKAKLEKEKAKEEKERLEREQAEREEKEREGKAKKAAEEAENESEEEAPAPKKKGRTTKKTYVKKTATRGKKRARAAVESEDESEAQSASEEVAKPKTKKAKLSNEKSDAEHVIEDVKMDEVKTVQKEEVKKDDEDEFIVDVVGTATPAKRVALPTPAIDDAIMADLPLEFEENIEIITTKTPSKPKVAPRISIDSQDEVDVVIKPKTANFIVHEESEVSSTVVASIVEPLNAEVTRGESEVDVESSMQIDSDAESQSETSQGPSTLTESGDDVSGKAEKKQKKVGFAASQSKSALTSSNSSKALDINDKLKRAADNRQMLEQKKREELEKKRAQAASKVEAMKKAREDSVKKSETASSNAAKKMDVEELKDDEAKKAEAAQELSKEEDAQSRRKRFLIQSLEEKKHNSASREAVDAPAPKPQGPAPAPQGPKLSLLAFLKKPALLTGESATQNTSVTVTSDPEESESSGSEKEVNVDLKSAANVIPKPTGVTKPPSSFSDLRKFIRDGSDEHVAPAPKPAVVAPTPVVTAPTPVVESKPLPSASNFGFKPISRENSANNISAPSSIKSATSTVSSGPSSLAPPSLSSVRDAQMMPPPQSPSSIRATSVKSFIPIKLAQSPKASPHSPQQQILSPKLSASMLYSPSPPRSPLRPRGFLDSPECQCPILDYCSDDDSDSEVDLPVPAWTQKENLYKALEMQTTVDPDEIFGKELGKNIDLNAIFGPNPRRPAYKK